MSHLSHVWQRIQGSLFPFLREELYPLTERQEKLAALLEVLRVEDFVGVSVRNRVGRPTKDRQAIARAFVAKAVYNIQTTAALVEQLRAEKNLRRIVGFEEQSNVPTESTFCRAFAEFAKTRLGCRVHEAIIAKHQSHRLVGHISRDSTAIHTRQKLKKKAKSPAKPKRKRGRPKKGESVESTAPKASSLLVQQQHMSLQQMLDALPTAATYGCKRNSSGHNVPWGGYKLHIDTADGDIPISCILTSASVHDSQVALPLLLMTKKRVENLYDLMDSAYDCSAIRAASVELGHVPIIEHNGRGAEKKRMDPATHRRYAERSSSERVNSRLKEEFGGRTLRVRGPDKTMAHLMFGIVVLTADQLLRHLV